MKQDNRKRKRKVLLVTSMKPDAISNNSIIADPNDLDQQIKSMMTLANVLSNDGRNRLAICNICGKEGPSNNMPCHIEANHITGISHTCNICGKTSRSRNALKMHKHTYHKDQARIGDAYV